MDRKREFLTVPLTWEGERLDDLTPSPFFRKKVVWERILAAILLIPGLPLIGMLIALVRLTSKGPGIFRQVRVGQDGRTFVMYKIRTMTRDAEAATGPVWTQVNDMRVTPVGYVLRKLHLDELPQLVNVLRGDMALIGPRPERPEFVHVLAKQIPNYLNRLAVLPGITGLAQINLPPDSDLNSVRRKLVLDLEYIAHAGFFLDLRMFVCTFFRLLGLSGENAMRIMRLHRSASLSSEYVPAPNGSAVHNPSEHTSSPRPAATPPEKASTNGTRHKEAVSPTKPR